MSYAVADTATDTATDGIFSFFLFYFVSVGRINNFVSLYLRTQIKIISSFIVFIQPKPTPSPTPKPTPAPTVN